MFKKKGAWFTLSGRFYQVVIISLYGSYFSLLPTLITMVVSFSSLRIFPNDLGV